MTEEIQEHSTRSPSGSAAWRRCPGKINAERGLPDRVGREAAEGTLFHEAAETCLKGGIDPQFLPQGETRIVSGHTVAFNQEMVDSMLGGLDLLDELIEPGDIVRIEEKVWIEPYTLEDGGFGTADVIIIKVKKRKIIVWDWKYGKIAVSPIENDQECLYGLGVWETVAGEIFDWDPTDIEVELIIWQPRVPGGGGRWPTTMEWLLEEGNRIRIDAAATYDPNAPRIPGLKQCEYCKAKKKCMEYVAYNLDLINLRFEHIDESIALDVTPPLVEDFDQWTPERRSYVWLHRKSITKWLQALHDEIMLDAIADEPTPLLKVVKGKGGRRKWKPKQIKAVGTYLETTIGKDKAWVPITPAVAEGLVGKKKFKEDCALYVDQSDPKPMLVPITDTRDPLPSKMIHFEGTEFDEDEDGEE